MPGEVVTFMYQDQNRAKYALAEYFLLLGKMQEVRLGFSSPKLLQRLIICQSYPLQGISSLLIFIFPNLFMSASLCRIQIWKSLGDIISLQWLDF
jgi:hypothetical protein